MKLFRSVLLMSALCGGVALAQTTPPPPAPASAPAATAPQVHIAVGVFKCNVPMCTSELGTGLADALMNALSETGKFAVYERDHVPMLAENNMISGVDPTAALSPVDVVVFGNVSTYEPETSSGQGCFLGVCLGGKESRIGADLRVVDTKTGRVLATTRVEGKSSSTGGSVYFRGLSLGGRQNSGLDKAIGGMLAQAVQVLQSKVPASYYR
ncbi:CsgG/HfaB family protein [Deinococcus navajonensis]|uniref:CsgG/HfaB family protein n=1 Tax=Deinococcus navajonensis TaxID=309884 RepID=A0ABV8XP28_9DEIO